MPPEKITKARLIEAVHSTCGTIDKNVVQRVVDAVLDEIKDSMKGGATLELRGFGTFEPRLRKGRNARNPKNGVSLRIDPHYVAAFRAGKELRSFMWELQATEIPQDTK